MSETESEKLKRIINDAVKHAKENPGETGVVTRAQAQAKAQQEIDAMLQQDAVLNEKYGPASYDPVIIPLLENALRQFGLLGGKSRKTKKPSRKNRKSKKCRKSKAKRSKK